MRQTPVPSQPAADRFDLGDPVTFDRRLGEVGIASLIVIAGDRMGPLMRRLHEPSDLVQEAVLVAWRDRAAFSGTDLRSFRAWLITLIDRRVRDLARRATAAKRGGGAVPSALTPDGASARVPDGAPVIEVPVQSTTPSRMVRRVEEADRIERALDDLGEPERSLIVLTVFDVVSVREAARRLEISDRQARDRLRRGLLELHAVLGELMPGGPA